MSTDGWQELARLRDLIDHARSNGIESVSLDRLLTWLNGAISAGESSRVAQGVASDPDPVIVDPVSVRTAAGLLSVSHQRIRALCLSGKLLAVRTPQGWMISHSAIMERIERGRDGKDQSEQPAA